jgi:hypothetical protein
MSTTSPGVTETESFKTLGEQAIDRDAFELDLKINESYQQYSAELLRLSLLAITGLAFVWLRIYLPDTPHGVHPPRFGAFMASSFALLAISAAAALVHRYTAADSLAYHLTALRRYKRRRPASGNNRADIKLGDGNRKKRDMLFRFSDFLLRFSAAALIIGVAAFGLAMWTLT